MTMVVVVGGIGPVVVVDEVRGSVVDVVGSVVDGSVMAGGVVDGTVEDGGTVEVDVEVVVGATPVSGDTQPGGGALGPVCPGIRTVPAHPKSEKVDSLVVVEPSEKCATERVWRMYPEASIDTSTVVPVKPCCFKMADESAIALASSALTPGTLAPCAGSIEI
jgi:hypothetical protein